MARKALASIRVEESFYSRMQGWQKQVKAVTGKEPTFTGILEAMETLVDEKELVELLTRTWRNPSMDDIKAAVAAVRKKR